MWIQRIEHLIKEIIYTRDGIWKITLNNLNITPIFFLSWSHINPPNLQAIYSCNYTSCILWFFYYYICFITVGNSSRFAYFAYCRVALSLRIYWYAAFGGWQLVWLLFAQHTHTHTQIMYKCGSAPKRRSVARTRVKGKEEDSALKSMHTTLPPNISGDGN